MAYIAALSVYVKSLKRAMMFISTFTVSLGNYSYKRGKTHYILLILILLCNHNKITIHKTDSFYIAETDAIFQEKNRREGNRKSSASDAVISQETVKEVAETITSDSDFRSACF